MVHTAFQSTPLGCGSICTGIASSEDPREPRYEARIGHTCGIESGLTPSKLPVELPWRQPQLGAHQGVVLITVYTVIRSRQQYVADGSPTHNHQVELVPVFGSGVLPRYSTLRFCTEQRVRDTELVVCTQLQEALSVFVHSADAELPKTHWPRFMISTYACVEIP